MNGNNPFSEFQRQRDDNNNKIFAFVGGGALVAERKIVQNAVFFRGKRRFCGGGGGALVAERKIVQNAVFFFVGNATTIEFWKCKFYCREILLSLRRLLELQARNKKRDRSANSDLPLPMVWRDHGLNAPLSAVSPMNKGFSVSGAPFFGFGLADPAPEG